MTVDYHNKTYDYVLVGGGMGAGYATLGIREHDKEGSILILSREDHVPYERPALTKKLWRDEEFKVEDTKIGAEEEENVDFAFERDVVEIAPKEKSITLDNGDVVLYKKLLLSTGGEPRSIDGPEDDNVFTFRELDDYLKLREFSKKDHHVIIVGGGYIGSELADSLTQNDTQVTMVFPQSQLGEEMFPEELLDEYNKIFTSRGVNLIIEKKAERYRREGDQLVLELDDGEEITGDSIVIGLGVDPRIELAQRAGLETANDGVVVNESLQTSDPNIYAAGDIATYPDQILGRQRIEHVDHARNSGKQVGAIMAGGAKAYTHTPYLYSVIDDLSWEAIGTLDPSLNTMFDHREDGDIVFYLDGDELKGVLLWDVEVDLDDIREVLDNPPANKEDLIGLLEEQEQEE
ncbi:MAG TPA: FAD-dependent oxidoreductase [Atopostipes sp.]|nr:FAD-dependent oxidoreductase [Atopostipes sp.]